MKNQSQRSQSAVLLLPLLLLLSLLTRTAWSFLTPSTTTPLVRSSSGSTLTLPTQRSPSSSALGVWWFGGSETETHAEDSCELVAVRIERTSANSRRIRGEIVVETNIDDVWSILTDYDRLAIHVPNLVESRIVQRLSPGQPGDGSFQCRLYQKGAQKIVGFEFGASVTMDMAEYAMSATNHLLPLATAGSAAVDGRNQLARQRSLVSQPDNVRRITFKCYDSFFFQEFDGEWKVEERFNDQLGQAECLLSYVVDVRPKGPVPVAALEWRIREDVPTNLRAVKAAALGQSGKTAMASKSRKAVARQKQQQGLDPKRALAGDIRMNVQWDRSETMAAYLDPQQQ